MRGKGIERSGRHGSSKDFGLRETLCIVASPHLVLRHCRLAQTHRDTKDPQRCFSCRPSSDHTCSVETHFCPSQAIFQQDILRWPPGESQTTQLFPFAFSHSARVATTTSKPPHVVGFYISPWHPLPAGLCHADLTWAVVGGLAVSLATS